MNQMSSPLRSPPQHPVNPIQHRMNPILSSSSSQSAMGSPLRPPIPRNHHQLSSQAAVAAVDRSEEAESSPLRSPIVTPKNPIPHKSQMISQFARDGSMTGDRSERVVVSPHHPSARSLSRPPYSAEIGTRSAVRRAAVGLRISAAVLSLVAFSVMAADKTKGWAGDSFDRYKEYRYCVAMNVIVFVYSSFQVYALIHRLIKKQHIIHRPIRHYFDFSMDQIFSYLLISASSSAATRTDGWVSMFGSDGFTDMANGSIAMSFLAFVALALSSLVSAYNLFRRSA